LTTLRLVRHGRAAAGWDAERDPGLDDVGRAQAQAMAAALAPLGPLAIVVSPLRRTRETAAALERVWDSPATVEPGVGELVSPIEDLAARGEWLRGLMSGPWEGAGAELAGWRQRVVETLLAIEEDTVVVTHFVAINVAVGAATGDDRVMSFRPANCSVTVVESDGATLRLVERGREGESTVVV
jgi:broad specificity phosphatase PhoE